MQTDNIASKHLGKKTNYEAIRYSPSLLVAVPRDENRAIYNIDNNNLPFKGFDVWHCYEFSTLTNNNIPLTRVLKFKYDCNSDFIVESKSLKLYLNSYNMSNFGDNVSDALRICKTKIEQDLSEKLNTNVVAEFIKNEKTTDILSNYAELANIADINNLKIAEFKENPDILITESAQLKEYRLKFTSLRSNCRVTHQPDFGDAFIYYKSNVHIKEYSLLKYLTSFRCEYHFHEECVEMIYKRLSDILNKSDKLAVCALYSRRGGIDINPVRMSENCDISDFDKLLDINLFTRCGIKQ